MHRINLISTNKWIANIIIFLIIIITIAVITSYIVVLYLIPESVIGKYILENIYYIFFVVFSIIMYFIITGLYYYRIKIDSSVVYITAYRIIFFSTKPRNFLDISHTMLSDFCFFNRPFSFNRTLMIKIETYTGKKVVKRFNLTFLSKKEEEKISKVLKQIIAKNS